MSDPSILLRVPGTVLLDDRPGGRSGGTTALLAQPRAEIVARHAGEVSAALARIDPELWAGRFVAGYVSYDAGRALDFPHRLAGPPARHTAQPPELPLVWLGVYDQCRELSADAVQLPGGGPPPASPPPRLLNVRLNVSRAQYVRAVERARAYIAAGDVYQVNYACKLHFQHAGPPDELFAYLRRTHPVDHAAYINGGPWQVLSLSPELFLRRRGPDLLTRPMKGTLHRGRWAEEDEALAARLAADPKNRAENVMIVDLMRNDLGRVCQFGSIRVQRPLHVEPYRSLLQMTSDVAGRLRPGVTTGELLRAVFPPGSVTGAPKIRAMEIIDELEIQPRGVYCGAVVLFKPDGDCLLNVAIRTIVCRGQNCELGLGSGIVADSDPAAEWQEVLLKGRFLTAAQPAFELLETLRLEPDPPPPWADQHVARMRRSARYFGWDFPEPQVREALRRAAAQVRGPTRLRLLLAENGLCRTAAAPLSPTAEPVRLVLAARTVDPDDPFLYHKTTNRAAYDADLQEAQRRGFFDLVYRNAREEITEGAITNLIFQIDGRWVTPPLACGLLPGLWRAGQLAAGVTEQLVRSDDLRRATRIVAGNSVRGALPVAEIVAADGRRTLWHAPLPKPSPTP